MQQRLGPIHQAVSATPPRGPRKSAALHSLFCSQHGHQLWGQNRRPCGVAVGTSALHHSATLSRPHRASRYPTTLHPVSCEQTGCNGGVCTHALLGLRLEQPPLSAIRPSYRDSVAQTSGQRFGTPCSAKACMTAVAFEPTPLLTDAWGQRLAPLGQPVVGKSGVGSADAFASGVAQRLGLQLLGSNPVRLRAWRPNKTPYANRRRPTGQVALATPREVILDWLAGGGPRRRGYQLWWSGFKLATLWIGAWRHGRKTRRQAVLAARREVLGNGFASSSCG